MSAKIQVWINAAFDDNNGGGLEKSQSQSVDMKAAWIDVDHHHCLTASIESSENEKENRNPEFKTPPGSNSNTRQMKLKNVIAGEIGVKKNGVGVGDGRGRKKEEAVLRDDAVINLEIERIEMEMSQLVLKLEALRLEKVQKKVRIGERRGSIVPAKYMEQKEKQSRVVNVNPNSKLGGFQRNQDLTEVKDSKIPQRRGVSLCPQEIYSRSRQVVNKAETEISNGSGLKQANRRQSCFWKMGEIDELKITKVRGGRTGNVSATVSPRARKAPVPRFDAGKKQALTSIGAKKGVRKEAAVAAAVQPKKLFKEGEGSSSTSVQNVKKPGRVVASRYNCNSSNSSSDSANKLSLRSSSEKEGKEEMKVVAERRRDSIASTGSRLKKRWDIPAKGEVVVYKSGEEAGDEEDVKMEVESTPVSDEIVTSLPKIRTVRCLNQTPRDSGAVKRVADLVGKKSVFGGVGVEEEDVCQALSFVDEEDGDCGAQETQS